LAEGERDGASVSTSRPTAGVCGAIPWGEVGPQETMESTENTVHAATADGARKRANMLQVRRGVQGDGVVIVAGELRGHGIYQIP